MKAKHIQEGKTFDYKNTGSSKVELGDVVVIGTRVAIAATEIEAGETGTVEVGEVYDIEKDSNAITLGAKVYYEESTGKATATASKTVSQETVYNIEMGYAIAAATAAATTVRVKLLA